MKDPFKRPDPDLTSIHNLLQSLIIRKQQDVLFFKILFWISTGFGLFFILLILYLRLDLYLEIGSFSLWSALGALLSNQEMKARQNELTTALGLFSYNENIFGSEDYKELILELLKKDSGL